jgi:citrate synthase
MRNIMGLFHDISILDAQTGITFRGYSIPECDKHLPKSNEPKATQPLPESMVWLLLTGEIPN